jgi:hypothetical protein
MSFKKLAPWSIAVLLVLLAWLMFRPVAEDSTVKFLVLGQGMEVQLGADTLTTGTHKYSRADSLFTRAPGGRVRMTVQGRNVSMGAASLKEVHVLDVTNGVDSTVTPDITTAVLGYYEDHFLASSFLPVAPVFPALTKDWKCVTCGDILVCGVNPQCR